MGLRVTKSEYMSLTITADDLVAMLRTQAMIPDGYRVSYVVANQMDYSTGYKFTIGLEKTSESGGL